MRTVREEEGGWDAGRLRGTHVGSGSEHLGEREDSGADVEAVGRLHNQKADLRNPRGRAVWMRVRRGANGTAATSTARLG